MSDSTPSRPVARRRVSHQRYVARRIGVGALAVVVLAGGGFGVAKAVGALGGSGDEVDGGSAPTTTVAAGSRPPATSTSSRPGAATTTTVTPTTAAPTTTTSTTTTTTTTPPGPVVPSAEHPAKVLIVGDSDAGAFGPYLKKVLNETGIVTPTLDYKVSSGLARPDFHNWPDHLATDLTQIAPDIVIITFGGNETQGLANPDGSNPSEWNDPVDKKDTWLAEYTRRVVAFIDQAAAGGRTVIWVGIPNDVDPVRTQRLGIQNAAVHAALAQRPAVQFVDTWAMFASANGGYAEYAIDPRDGQGKDVRASDGFHLNQSGAEILAIKIADVVKADLKARGAQV